MSEDTFLPSLFVDIDFCLSSASPLVFILVHVDSIIALVLEYSNLSNGISYFQTGFLGVFNFLLSQPQCKSVLFFLQVSQMYDETHKIMYTSPVKDYLPYSWVSMVMVKSQYYLALSHFYIATGLLEQKGNNWILHQSVASLSLCKDASRM